MQFRPFVAGTGVRAAAHAARTVFTAAG